MEKVYRLLKWLSAEQAIDWLQDLTATEITFLELSELCNAGHCGIYVDCSGTHLDDDETGMEIELCGVGKVVGDSTIGYACNEAPLSLEGRFRLKCDAFGVWSREDLVPDFHIDKTFYISGRRLPRFKPDEIRALACKLNGVEAPKEKPLHPSERKSASQIIAVLAAMAKLNLAAPYKADEALRAAAAVHGLELPASPETVVKFLKTAVTADA